MDAHWYVLDQGVFKSWVVYPCILKQAHIASTALLGTPLTVDRDHDRWSCELLFSGSSATECLHFGPVNGCSTMHTPRQPKSWITHPTPLHGAKAYYVPTSFFQTLTTQMTPAEQRDGRTLVCLTAGGVQRLGCTTFHRQTSTHCFHRVVGDNVDR